MLQIALSPIKALAAWPACVGAEFADFCSTVLRYYPNASFRRADLHCLREYLGHSPEAICRRYLADAPPADVQRIYGETLLTTLEQIADAAAISEQDVVYDLGCGRGRNVFWLRTLRGCRAVGVDLNRYFIVQARRIQRKAEIKGVEFVLANVMDLDYEDATVIYLYGSAFSDRAIAKLVHRFASLKPGTRVISVSYPLNAYAHTPMFRLEKKMTGAFPWGEAEIYIQRKV